MPASRRKPFAGLFIIACLQLGIAGAGPANGDYASSIRLAVDHWLAVQRPSGLLPYGFDFLADEESEPDAVSMANLARQIYAASVLADYYARSGDARARPALARFLSAFGERSMPIRKGRLQALVEATHVLSVPVGRYKLQSALTRLGLMYEEQGPGSVPSPDRDYGHAYAGSVALALLTELRYSETSGDARFANLREAWLEGLLALRIPGRGFRQLATTIDPAPYSDGQGWLALAEYHRRFPQDRRVADALADVDGSLLQIYGREYRPMFYHWGTMAAAARYSDTRDARFLALIKFQTAAFLEHSRKSDGNDCASAEGMADARAALMMAGEDSGALAEKMRDWLAAEMDKATRLQIGPGREALVFANARVVAPRLRDFAGSFLAGRGDLKTQIDYTAHCVSAMLKLQR